MVSLHPVSPGVFPKVLGSKAASFFSKQPSPRTSGCLLHIQKCRAWAGPLAGKGPPPWASCAAECLAQLCPQFRCSPAGVCREQGAADLLRAPPSSSTQAFALAATPSLLPHRNDAPSTSSGMTKMVMMVKVVRGSGAVILALWGGRGGRIA